MSTSVPALAQNSPGNATKEPSRMLKASGAPWVVGHGIAAALLTG